MTKKETLIRRAETDALNAAAILLRYHCQRSAACNGCQFDKAPGGNFACGLAAPPLDWRIPSDGQEG